MHNKNFLEKKTIYFMVASLISFVYMCIYISIPNNILRDRENYILYVTDVDYFINRYEGYSILFNEPIFLFINKYISHYFDYNNVPIIFVLFNTFFMMFFLIKYSKNLTFFILGLIFVIFFPYLFQAQLIALRQALATSIFLISFFYFRNPYKILISLIFCSFIHSIFFLITFFYFLNFILINKFSLNKKILINFLIILIVSLLLLKILSFFGLRQANEYGDSTANALKVGGGGFIVMSIVFAGLYLQRKKINNNLYTIVMVGLTLFIAGYFVNPIIGRLFNTFAPFLVIFLISHNTKINFILLIFLCLIYGILYFNGSYNDIFLYEYNSVIDILKLIG